MSDEFLFAEEEPAVEVTAEAAEPVEPWLILIVDDDPAIHATTKMVLRGFSFEGRPAQFLSAATAAEAGIDTRLLPLHSIAWDGRRFLDDEGQAISWLAKLYPWDGLADDGFLQRLRSSGMSVLSPLWCWLWSNHGLLAVLSSLYPRHPNLCRAALDPSGIAGAEMVTVRAFHGLDGAPTRVLDHGVVVADDGPEIGGDVAAHGAVWLETPPCFREEDSRAVLHAWIVGDKCLGMGVRESTDPRLGLGGGPEWAMVPHLFRG